MVVWLVKLRRAEIAEAFMSQNPDVKVIWLDQGYGFDGKLMAAIAAGNPPGLVYNVGYMDLAMRGLLIPLDDYIAASSVVSLTDGDIPDYKYEKFTWEGKHYGVPAYDTSERYALGVNLTVAEEAGLDINNIPQTWSEVFEWHKAMTKYDQAGNVEVLGMAPTSDASSSAYSMDPWVYPRCGDSTTLTIVP